MVYTVNKIQILTYSKSQQETLKYYNIISGLFDYNILTKMHDSEKDSFLSKINWSENDYNISRSSFNMHPDLYNINKLNELKRNEKNQILTSPILIIKYIAAQGLFIIKQKYFIILLIFSFFLLFIGGVERKILLSMLFFIIGIIISDGLAAIILKAFPYRVQLGLYTCWFFLVILNIKIVETYRNKITLTIIFILISFSSFPSIIYNNKLSLVGLERLNKTYTSLNRLGKDSHFYDWNNGIPNYWVLPFYKQKEHEFKIFRIYTFSCCDFMSIDREKYGITDTYLDILKPNSYLVIDKAFTNDYCSYYITFMKEHYSKNVSFSIVEILVNGSNVIKMKES